MQLNLPLRNRIAEADLVRDELQVKQSEIRLRQLQNQARLEVEDALIAMRRARASYDAAVQARALQQESLAAEQAKFEVGASTSFFVIQYESLLAQARSTEVAAQSSYVKAKGRVTTRDRHHPRRKQHQRGSRDQRKVASRTTATARHSIALVPRTPRRHTRPSSSPEDRISPATWRAE